MLGWLRTIGLIFGVGVALRLFGFDAGMLYSGVVSRLDRAATDTGALVRGEYVERTSDRLRNEAAQRIRAEADRLPNEVPGDEADAELRGELAAERKRILREKAEQAEKAVSLTLKGDMKGLRRQVEENARLAGGTTQ